MTHLPRGSKTTFNISYPFLIGFCVSYKNHQINAILRLLQEPSKTLININHIMNNLHSSVELINLIRTFKIQFN